MNMKKDGIRGGAQVISEINQKGHKEAVTTEIHYTVLGLMAGNGEPVCCVAIIPSKSQKIPLNWVTGIIIAALINEGRDEEIHGEI